MKNIRFLTFLGVVMLCWGCHSQVEKQSFPGPPDGLEITKEQFLDNNLADSMIIYEPDKLQTDSAGNVYVFDEAQMDIKVFSEEGRPLRIVGNRGRGPGEFISNSGFFVYRDSIYAFDQKLQRLNVFSTTGKAVTTHSLNVAAPVILKPLGKDHHLGIYSSYTGPESPSNTTYAREHDRDFSTGGKPFLKLTQLIPGLEDVEGVLKFYPGHFLMTDDYTFIYAPYFYNGKLYQFEKENGRWKNTNTYKGNVDRYPYTLLENSSGRYPDLTLSSIRLNKPLEFVVHNQSRGLLMHQDKIYHFTQCEFDNNREERVFGVGLFNTQMQPLGYVPIKRIPIAHKRGNTIGWHAEAMDSNGNIYIRERNIGNNNIWLLKFDW
ncbi:6-bladed beta-propeller [Fodinibius salsisoli]|uniref:6-bladed beta-propeller n=1 Tax=Fodinibius salsisoli TaxID=2820877 RepID=A0ABT3PQQ4_9BACT|nr:6-bladed beta-propeller [Fodinibius salsisoli]MCW9708194.1 6-bladed beta-propeller [Fodinibius salsisoli]